MAPVTVRLVLVLVLGLLVVLPVAALPTPGFNGPEAREVTGRIFPEALDTNDYIGYFEALEGLRLLAEENPSLLEFVELGESVGWPNTQTGAHDRLTPFAVLVTNGESAVAPEDKVNILFMLSIHGNEKGGREGGFRVIEDFVKATHGDADTGMATPERLAMLDYMRLVLLFPNPDGWAHEEFPYRAADSGYFSFGGVETQNFVRVNGNGVDLNRQLPTQGWSRALTSESHKTLSQPESQAYGPWLKTAFPKIHYATDIHGMLHPADALINSSEPVACLPPGLVPDAPGPGVPFVGGIEDACIREGHFLLTLLPAGRFNALEEVQIMGLSELLEERINTDPFYAEWVAVPEAGVWGGEFNSWGTVWDTIGYVDSGFSGDFFAQDIGLDAPGMDFEMAYNHVVFDNYYPGAAARINDFHVHSVRQIVGVFMDFAARDVRVSIDAKGTRTAWVPTAVVATNLDDEKALSGWAMENPADDAWDLANNTFRATINDYFRDLKAFLTTGGAPGTLDEFRPQDLARADLARYTSVVVPGSASDGVRGAGAVAALKAYVEAGGTLVVTDSALRLLPEFDVVGAGDVGMGRVYAGYTDLEDREHALAAGVRGLARQLVEPMPLGFEEGDNMPEWTIERAAFEAAGGAVVGVTGGSRVAVGELPLGKGRVVVIGALLPDPTEEYYHPYGLASYATTYTGNQIVRNALGWELRFETPPRILTGGTVQPAVRVAPTDTGNEDDTPAPPLAVVVLAIGLVAVALRRRR